MLPNRLSTPGEHAARERVESLFARIDEIGVMSLMDLIIPSPDTDHRDDLLAELDRTAAAHGRVPLLDEALERVRDALLANVADRWPAGTYFGQARGSARAADRIAVERAIEDAVAVAVVEDVLDPDVARALADPGRALLGLPPLGPPGVAGAAREARDPGPAWAPSDADWAAADRGVTAVRPGERASIPGSRTGRLAVAGALVIVGVPTSIAWILTQPGPLIGVAAAAIVVLLAWTLAFPPSRD